MPILIATRCDDDSVFDPQIFINILDICDEQMIYPRYPEDLLMAVVVPLLLPSPQY